MYVFGNKVKADVDDSVLGTFSSHNAAYRAFSNCCATTHKFELDPEDKKEFDKMREKIDNEHYGNIHC